MTPNYTVRMVSRGDMVEYRDAVDVYRFLVWFKLGEWIVYLPSMKGKYYQPYELTDDENNIMFPRIRSYLAARKRRWWFGCSYPVSFELEEVSPAMEARRLWLSQYMEARDKANAEGPDANGA